MKPIKTSNSKISLSGKIAIFLVFIIGLISFILSIRFSGEQKKEYPELTIDTHLPPPQCSMTGGFYKEAFSVSLIPFNGEKIYYTLDGSEPSLSSVLYEKPIIIQNRTDEPNVLSAIPTSTRWMQPLNNVFKGTVLRAVTVTDNNKKSSELSNTFFIDEKGRERYSFPVVEITANPDDLFGYEKGIYVMGKQYEDKDFYIRKKLKLDMPWWKYPSNYLKRGGNSERKVFVEFFEPKDNNGFQSKAGIRINGNATRGFSQKSLRLLFDEKYGNSSLNYPIFKQYDQTVFTSIVLRNSGNDWDKTMFRDVLMQSLMDGSELDVQHYRPVVVFINGEYWGIHNICERLDEKHLALKYKIPVDSVALLEISGGKLIAGKKRDAAEFEKLMKYISQNDMSVPSKYQYVCEQIDIPNFIDMIIANVYFCNGDWPGNNVKFWRYAEYDDNKLNGARDGKYRWILYDTDWGFGNSGKASINLNLLKEIRKSAYIGIIFDKLLNNTEFADKFISRFNYHLNNTFKTEVVLSRINELEKMFRPEMSEHIDRWRAIGSIDNWENNVNEVKTFAKNRPSIQRTQLNELIRKLKSIKE